MPERKDPYRVFRFQIEINKQVVGGFSEVTVPDTSTDIVEYRTGDDPTYMKKLPGLTKYANVTLKGGTTDSMALYEWRKLVIDGKMKDARRSMAIIILDEEGNHAARWEFENAWPTKYDPADLNAKGNDVAIETMEIVHEGMTRVKV